MEKDRKGEENYLEMYKPALDRIAANIDRLVESGQYHLVNINRDFGGNTYWKSGYLTTDSIREILEIHGEEAQEYQQAAEDADFVNRSQLARFEHEVNYAVTSYQLHQLRKLHESHGNQDELNTYSAISFSGEFSTAELTPDLQITRTIIKPLASEGEPLLFYSLESSDSVIEQNLNILSKGKELIDISYNIEPIKDDEMDNCLKILGIDNLMETMKLFLSFATFSDEQLNDGLNNIGQSLINTKNAIQVHEALEFIRRRFYAYKENLALMATMDSSTKYPLPELLDTWQTVLESY